jgi:hypothetical protein
MEDSMQLGNTIIGISNPEINIDREIILTFTSSRVNNFITLSDR